jgi:hypothetical protein
MRLGHISWVPSNHAHVTEYTANFKGYNASWLMEDGGNRYLSLYLRWDDQDPPTQMETRRPCAYYLFVTVSHSDENLSATTLYLGMTLLSTFYAYMLPLAKYSTSLTFSLSRQCACGKVLPLESANDTLQVPPPGSGQYLRTEPSPSDWIFKGHY